MKNREKNRDKLILEMSDYANISVKESSKINDYLEQNYVLRKKKSKNLIKELWKKDSVDYYLKNEKRERRYDFIDVAKAIAIIFIFIGHWSSPHLGVFAYSFHLFLFFMVSGFFALHMQKNKFIDVVKKLFLRLVIPLVLWAIISIVIGAFKGSTSLKQLLDVFLKTGEVQPNYWFIPCLFATSIYYWIFAKIIKKPWIIVIITFALNVFLGEAGLYSDFHFDLIRNIPVIGPWIDFSGFLTYGFWFSLGAASLPLVINYIDSTKSEIKIKKGLSLLFAGFTLVCTMVLLLHKSNFQIFLGDKLVYKFFTIARALVIILAVFFLSDRMSMSKVLCKIGKNTLIYVGMEFIIHDFIAVTLLPSFNLGIYNFCNELSIIMYNLLTVLLVYMIIDPINNYFPILNGKIKNNNS